MTDLSVTLGPSDGLIVVDVQNDFLPGGSLAVPRGDEVVKPLNGYLEAFRSKGLSIYATRDWHPPNHCSFRDRGGQWPAHCVMGSPGADFAPALLLVPGTVVVSKASAPDQEAYSGFQGTELANRLRKAGIRRLFVGGLATDYCVLHTVLDALRSGFEVYLLSDAVRAVEVERGDGERAVARMERLGATSITIAALEA